MKPRISVALFLILVLAFAGFVVAQTTSMVGSGTTATQPNSAKSPAAVDNTLETHPVHRTRAFSADDLYKQNCTRCHAEVPNVNERITKTAVRHMRVRANLTQDEAKAILEYLTQ